MLKEKVILSESTSAVLTKDEVENEIIVKGSVRYQKNSFYTYLAEWLAYKDGIYYLNSDLLFEEVCESKSLLLTYEQTLGVEKVISAVIEQSPEESTDIVYRTRLILNGSGTECRLIVTGAFTRNNGGNIWKSVNPEPDPRPDLLVNNSQIKVEVKTYGSEGNAKFFVEGKPAYKFYNADFVCCRLINAVPQKWIWYEKRSGYFTKCTKTPDFLKTDLDLQPEICKVSYDYSTGHRCLKISIN